jgi:hypothetical protein
MVAGGSPDAQMIEGQGIGRGRSRRPHAIMYRKTSVRGDSAREGRRKEALRRAEGRRHLPRITTWNCDVNASKNIPDADEGDRGTRATKSSANTTGSRGPRVKVSSGSNTRGTAANGYPKATSARK